MKQIIIIGAGIIGATLAYRLAGEGREVTIVDQGSPAGGATGATFGWLNASFYLDDGHHRLRAEGLEAWDRLAEALPDLPLQREPAIWCEAQGGAFWEMRDRLVALDYPVSVCDHAALTGMVPGWVAPDAALQFTAEAVVDGSQGTQALLAAAMLRGVKSVFGVRVTGLRRSGAQVTGVQTDVGVMAADEVIVAAGNGAEALIGLPMNRRPGLLLRTQPLPRTLNHVLVTPDGEIRQDLQGRFIMPTAAGHQGDEADALTDDPVTLADQALARLQAHFPGIPMVWTEVQQAFRPVPQDGLPVIGRVSPGLYVTVMHSGMTLAAITGEYAAQEILRGDLVNALGPYRPDRFNL